jgi:hypothetical protein
MPDVSRKQQVAMIMAKKGQSTLGIPKKVGEDFIAADNAAGNPSLPERAPKKKKSLGDEFNP